MSEIYVPSTESVISPPGPLASGSLNATIEKHLAFNSSQVFFRSTLPISHQVEISAVDDDRQWIFNFDENIKPNKYFIDNEAIKRIWYTQPIPNDPSGKRYVFTPAPSIGTITIKAFDITAGIFEANFDFYIWRKSEGPGSIAKATGTINVWDMDKPVPTSN
jgi:hypothetical protein